MNDKIKKLKNFRKIRKICLGMGIGAIGIATAGLFTFFLGLGNLTIGLFSIAAIILAPCYVTDYLVANKEQELENLLNSSVNGVTKCGVVFETEEYTPAKTINKEIIVISPKDIGLQDIDNNGIELEK